MERVYDIMVRMSHVHGLFINNNLTKSEIDRGSFLDRSVRVVEDSDLFLFFNIILGLLIFFRPVQKRPLVFEGGKEKDTRSFGKKRL